MERQSFNEKNFAKIFYEGVDMGKNIQDKVKELAALLEAKSWTVATAESCTGGLIASTLTDLSGSSSWFTGGIVAYSNPVKMDC